MLPSETTSMPTTTAAPTCSQPLPTTSFAPSPTSTPAMTPSSSRTARWPRFSALSVRQTIAAIGAKIGAGWRRTTWASTKATTATTPSIAIRTQACRRRPAARPGRPASRSRTRVTGDDDGRAAVTLIAYPPVVPDELEDYACSSSGSAAASAASISTCAATASRGITMRTARKWMTSDQAATRIRSIHSGMIVTAASY